MDYIRCSKVDREVIYESFVLGFSDYPVPMTLDVDGFFDRFFGPEGNGTDHSFVAVENGAPAGLILGGVRRFDGYRNMRCGTLCVPPELRGTGVSGRLFELFLENAMEIGCERLSLEVLADNERAISFYERRGYERRNKLLYFGRSTGNTEESPSRPPVGVDVVETDVSVARECREGMSSLHINWQNEADYFRSDRTSRCFAAYERGEMVGTTVISGSGKVYFLWVSDSCRRRGIGRNLLCRGVDAVRPEKLSTSMPDNIDTRPFLDETGFVKESVEQYEMFRMV